MKQSKIFQKFTTIAATVFGIFIPTIISNINLKPAKAISLIGVNYDFPSSVFTIDEMTGSSKFIGFSGFNGLNSLAIDSTGMLFSAEDAEEQPSNLITINPATGQGKSVALIDLLGENVGFRGLAFSPDDVLFAFNVNVLTLSKGLYTIDITTGIGTLISNNFNDGIQALDFSPEGILFGWAVDSGLLTIDTVTGKVVDVNTLEPGTVKIQSIAFSPDGKTLYGAGDGLYKINIETGVPTLIGGQEEYFFRGIVAVPEPLTIFGAAVAASFGAFFKRKLKESNSDSE